MSHISKSMEKIKEMAKKRRKNFEAEKQKAESRKRESGGGKPEAGKELFKEYSDEIEGLSGMERDIWASLERKYKVRLLNIIKKCDEYKFYKDSSPRMDMDWAITMYDQYGMRKFARALYEGYLWLKSNPKKTKKNYRRFVLNWIKNEGKDVNINIVKKSDENY